MHKKTERANYALASSSISDIPLSIEKRELQVVNKNQTGDYKQNSSIYHAFNQSRSRMDESSSLHYSTARPFYQEAVEDYYERRQLEESPSYNPQQRNNYNMQKIRSKKSPNKRVMIYSYSNLVLFNKKINKIIIELKKRLFQILRRTKREEKNAGNSYSNKNTSFYSGETNNTSHEDVHFRGLGLGLGLGLLRREEKYNRQQMVQAINIMEGWLQYRALLDKRKSFYLIYEHGNERKRFSLQLSQSLKIDNPQTQNYYFTDSPHSGEISLLNALPQQIEESLVYTLEHNNESTRKQFTQSTLEKFPTAKQYPSSVQLQIKQKDISSESQISKKNSPVHKLKNFKNSPSNSTQDLKIVQPLKLACELWKNRPISVQKLMDTPLDQGYEIYYKENNPTDHQNIAESDDIKANLSLNDQHEFEDIKPFPLEKQPVRIENSAKYSDVSNYRIENTVHKQEQYQVKVNYASSNKPMPQDQTVLRRNGNPQDERTTPAKIEKYYLTPKDGAIATPKFVSEIHSEGLHHPQMSVQSARTGNQKEKMVSQLENDRIRIFGRIKAPEGKSLRDNLIVSPNGLSEMRGNFVISPNNPPTHMSPIVVNSEKRFISPMQSERVVTRPIVNHFKNVPIQQPSLRVIQQPLGYQRTERSPEYLKEPQKQVFFAQKEVKMTPRSPPAIEINRRNQQPQPQPQFQQQQQMQQHQQQTQQIQYISQRETSPAQPKQLIQNFIPQNLMKMNPNPKLSPQIQNVHKINPASPRNAGSVINSNFRPSKQKNFKSMHVQDYGFTQSIPIQKQMPIIRHAFSPNNHLANVQNDYQLPTAERRYPSPPPAINRQQDQPPPSHNPKQPVQREPKWGILPQRPQSSASSPKLFFNYKPSESHLDEQIVIHSHLTKNSSSISRPKSMNSKLHVTLRKEL